MSIVLCRLPNHIGDCCNAIPALQLLASSGVTPILTGKRWAEDLMAGTGWRFEPIEGHVSEDWSRIRRIARLADESKHALLFPNSFSSALLYRVGGLKSAGFGTDGRSILLDKVLPQPATRGHELVRFFTLAKEALLAWGLTPKYDEPPAEIGMKVLKRHEAAARNLIQKNELPEKFVVLAPTARGTPKGQSKAWAHFNALCQPLRDMGYEPVVFPSPREVEQCQAACPDARILQPTTLGNLAALLKHSSLVISNDSGVSHIAAGMSVPQVVIFGVTDPVAYTPWNAKASILGSLQTGWPSVEEVVNTVRSKLQGQSA